MNKSSNVSVRKEIKKKMRPVITVGEKEYPCDLTMGALLGYKRETGEELSEVKEGEVCKLVTLMWCCVVSASRRDKADFDMSLDEFADNIDPQDVAAWANVTLVSNGFNAEADGNGEDEEKKA